MTQDLPTRAGDEFRFIKAGGHRLRVFTRDLDKAGPPLVICNGLGQAIEMLLPMMEALPERPIISFDAAGVGRSDTPDHGASMQDHALMLRAVLDELGVDRFDILGISWGGALAQQIAHDLPDRCRKLVLAITSAGGIASWWGSPVALAEIMFPWRYFNKAYGNFIGPFMYGGEAILHPELFRAYSRHAIRPTYEGYSAQVKAMCSWSSLPWLHRLTQPTQIIAGAGDMLIPVPNQILLASLIPDAKLKIFPAGHLVMYSRREEVGQLMTGFLNAA
ncbi:alpha/beta fold hydrolase [Pseudorhodobacter aquimaris]|uniref:alpha/beta fold hydrolase n=1 Tax=Pseudorhodobacter aquimaris TaxID=687412 RepID=UPI00067C237A|nr:alpha/beta hydrolase [Pseudorhodobacter aquimaris]